MSDLSVDVVDGIVTIRFDRPAKLNAMTPEMLDVVRATVQAFGDTPEQRVLLFTATGRYFSAGMDIHRMPRYEGLAGSTARRQYRRLHTLWDEIESIEKPVVLAAHAPCIGGALELALSCDFRLASDAASFGLPEIELGVLPGSGGISRLTRLVGPGWARWLAMAGESIDAERALHIGLVHEVVPAGGFEERVAAFTRRLADLPGEAVSVAKLAIDACEATDRATARSVERLANQSLQGSEDHLARRAAFEGAR